NPNPGNNAPVAITLIRWMGDVDEMHSNNEFVEVTLDPHFAPDGAFDLANHRLRNNRGDTYTFPAGFTVRQDRPVRIYTGPGQRTATELYWGRSSGVWDNMGDRVRLLRPNGQTLYRLQYGPAR